LEAADLKMTNLLSSGKRLNANVSGSLDNPDQPRHSEGKFASGGAERRDLPSAADIRGLKARIEEESGFKGEVPFDKDDYDHRQLIGRGSYASSNGAKKLPGEPNSCHGNSVNFWKKAGGKYWLVTGFAYGIRGQPSSRPDGWREPWVEHTWLVDKKGTIYETTGVLRKGYFGYLMNDKETFAFYSSQKDNLRSKGHVGRHDPYRYPRDGVVARTYVERHGAGAANPGSLEPAEAGQDGCPS